jgi:putative DNA primase/helicase
MVAILPRPQRESGLEVIEGAQAPSFQPPEDGYTGDVMYLPSKPTDDQIGDVLIQDWQGRYAHFYGTWYEYQHGVWLPAKNLRHQIWEKMKWLRHTGGCSELRPSANRVAGVEAYLSEYLRADEPAENMNYINLQNGIFNLEKNRLEEHRKDLFMTSQLPFAYDPDAGCSQFMRFLQSTLVLADGQADWQMIKVLQEAMGYSLTASTDYRVSFWLVGESGTGKSVMINVLIALAGNSHASVDLDALSNNPYQLADIAGKRLVTFTEPRANGVLADGHYKRLVSQDTIMARQIFGKPFTFVPCCKVWGAMNDTPRVIDRSDAVFNRVIIIPMNRLVSPEERDPRLINKLEAELAGIFNWALIGWKRLQKAGIFSTAEQIEQARADYKAENDTESLFLEECGDRDPEAFTESQRLYETYTAWCKRNGLIQKSSVKVARDWKRLGLRHYRKTRGVLWYGIHIPEGVESGAIT